MKAEHKNTNILVFTLGECQYRVMKAIEGQDTKVAYINWQNEEMVLKNIYKEIKTLDK